MNNIKFGISNWRKEAPSIIYRIGDTLYSIGRKFGVSVPVLKKLNNLKDNTISIGQKLVLN